MTLYDIFILVAGQPPAGYEPIVYIFGGLITYRMIEMVASLFEMVGRSWK